MGARDGAWAPRLRPHAAASGRVLVGGSIDARTVIAWRANRSAASAGARAFRGINGCLPALRAPSI